MQLPYAYLVERREINYVPNIDMDVDRDRLADPSGGIMDEARSVRNTYGVDVVVLLVGDLGQDGCGIALCTPDDPSEGYSGRSVTLYVADCVEPRANSTLKSPMSTNA